MGFQGSLSKFNYFDIKLVMLCQSQTVWMRCKKTLSEKGLTWCFRQPRSRRVSSTVSPAHWQRGRRGLTGYVRAANKCLNGRVGPKKGSVYEQTGWHHPDNGAARGSPILHLTSPKHNHKRTHPPCTCRHPPIHRYTCVAGCVPSSLRTRYLRVRQVEERKCE